MITPIATARLKRIRKDAVVPLRATPKPLTGSARNDAPAPLSPKQLQIPGRHDMPPAANGPPHAVAQVASGIPPLSFNPAWPEKGDRDLPLGGAAERTIERAQHEGQTRRCGPFRIAATGLETAPRQAIEGRDRRQPGASDRVRNDEVGQQIRRVEETGAGDRELNFVRALAETNMLPPASLAKNVRPDCAPGLEWNGSQGRRSGQRDGRNGRRRDRRVPEDDRIPRRSRHEKSPPTRRGGPPGSEARRGWRWRRARGTRSGFPAGRRPP